MNDKKREAPKSTQACPSCGSALGSEAILCVACGYHLTLRRKLSTVVGDTSVSAIDTSPYAASAASGSRIAGLSNEPSEFHLTESDAKQVKAVLSESQSVYLIVVVATILAPLWIVLYPWYTFRLYSWYSLNRRFPELRHPNSFSAYGELAEDFQQARWKLWVGVVVGLVMWILMTIIFLTKLFF